MSGDEALHDALPLLPLRNTVLLPGVTLPIELGRPTSVAAVRTANGIATGEPGHNLVLVAGQRDAMVESPQLEDLQEVGVVGRLVQIFHGLPGRITVFVHGLERVRLTKLTRGDEHSFINFEPFEEFIDEPNLAYALAGSLQDLVRRHDDQLDSERASRQRHESLQRLLDERNPGKVADMAATHADLAHESRVSLLYEQSVNERLRQTLEFISEHVNRLEVRRDVDEQVRDTMSQHEREAMLRHKMRAIQYELDNEAADWLDELKLRLDARELTEEAETHVNREFGRLEQMNPQSSEANVIRAYLEWVADLPWGSRDATADIHDIDRARAQLQSDHHGLDRVKRRVVEYLSILKLAPNKRGPVLCFHGPPGTGKTSLARSIAESLGREFVRISLGGVRDASEIRGHRRTYVGALPGRITQAMKRAASSNPVILLDELDKLGGDEMRGDPGSALLEVLDPEQNMDFEDHYIALPYDLSRVIFIATANYLGQIPTVLRDRLEVIEITSYTVEEKLCIARDHLIPRLKEDHGLGDRPMELTRDALIELTTRYTRESGVRDLQRAVASVMRDTAMRITERKSVPEVFDVEHIQEVLGPPRYFEEMADKVSQVGVVTGLGWTPSGGRLLFVEVTATWGDGKLRLTGRLGDVMKESAQAALSHVRSCAESLDIDRDFMKNHDIHVHLPSAAIPKDGPSAGVALISGYVSAMTGLLVRHDFAMTGEVTLRGQVLPVGGIREKVLAAHRAGIRDVILPERNRKDEPEIPKRAREDLRLHYVSSVNEVLDLVLLDADEASAAQ